MFERDLKKKVIAGAVSLGLIFSAGFYFSVIYQSPERILIKVIIKMHIIFFQKSPCSQI